MKSIDIDTEVFAKIWSLRVDGEEDENRILRRLLVPEEVSAEENVKWRDDVKLALKDLGDKAHLTSIYGRVKEIRALKGRSLPTHTRAIVRRELEYNSSDSKAHTGHRDWFRSVGGIGSGVWAIRK